MVGLGLGTMFFSTIRKKAVRGNINQNEIILDIYTQIYIYIYLDIYIHIYIYIDR